MCHQARCTIGPNHLPPLLGMAGLIIMGTLTMAQAGEAGTPIRPAPFPPATTEAALPEPLAAGSRAFGSIVHPVVGYPLSFVHWRKGYLTDRAELVAALRTQLRPLDIFIVKNGFRLSDKIIPGYFTHTALWLGTEPQLRHAGLWNDPAIRPLQARIRRGLTLVDVGRNGVRLERLETLLNTDRLVVIRVRPSGAPRRWRSRVMATALGYLGRSYDYNFDITTKRAVTCAELIYRSFPATGWPKRHLLGRQVVLPDDIAATALAGKGGSRLVLHIASSRHGGWRKEDAGDLAALLRGPPQAGPQTSMTTRQGR